MGLLRALHARVAIPPAVWREVVVEGQGLPSAVEVEEACKEGWLTVVAPRRLDLVRAFQGELDDGEVEALALAVEMAAEVLYVDETEARQTADRVGVPKPGVIGILVKARQMGLIPSLRAELERLRDEGGFWIGQELLDEVAREHESG